MSHPKEMFTIAQAQSVFALVERAPLQNLAEGRAVDKLLNDFANFVNAVHQMPNDPPSEQPADKGFAGLPGFPLAPTEVERAPDVSPDTKVPPGTPA